MSDAGAGLPSSDWVEYRRLVLSQIEEVNDRAKRIEQASTDMRVEIALLKQKAGVWGAIAGLVPSALAALIWYLSKGH